MSLTAATSGTRKDFPAGKTARMRKHVLTVSLEDYFQGAAFRNVLNQVHWSRFDQRVEQNTGRALELLSSLNVKATFFVSTWLAERVPDLIRRVAADGHEIASSGVTNRSFRELSEAQLREEARISRYTLEQLTNTRVRGYRVADHRLTPKDLWALEVLAEEGLRLRLQSQPESAAISYGSALSVHLPPDTGGAYTFGSFLCRPSILAGWTFRLPVATTFARYRKRSCEGRSGPGWIRITIRSSSTSASGILTPSSRK